jgi:hypothetical protein
MSNMDDFNKGAALIFAKLYDSFPKPLGFAVKEIDAEASLDTLINYEETMNFLKAERFIDFQIVSGFSGTTDYHRVVLTSKGLAALNLVPDVLQSNKPSLGRQITDLAKGGGKSFLTEGGKQLAKVLIDKVIEAAASGQLHW